MSKCLPNADHLPRNGGYLNSRLEIPTWKAIGQPVALAAALSSFHIQCPGEVRELMQSPQSEAIVFDQARRFTVSIIGPLRRTCVRDTLAYLGFERVGTEFKKTEPGKDRLAAITYEQYGAKYILIYNETKLLEWRQEANGRELRQQTPSGRLPPCLPILAHHSHCHVHPSQVADAVPFPAGRKAKGLPA